MLSSDDMAIPYNLNHTITYDSRFGQMSFLSQTLYVTNIEIDYSPFDERCTFEMEATVFPGESLGCPTGFEMADSGAWCSDLNECDISKERVLYNHFVSRGDIKFILS